MAEHLSEMAIEALAHGRMELVEPAQRAHVDGCDDCAARIDEARALSLQTERALREATPELDVQALVTSALQQVDARSACPARPSNRALVVSAVGGLSAAAAFGLAWLGRLPSVGAMLGAVRDGARVLAAVDRIVLSTIPGGWTLLAFAGAAALMLLTVALRALVRSVWVRGAGVAAAVLLSLLAAPPRAAALELEGSWPRDEQGVTVAVEREPASEALRHAAESVGLGLVATLPDDPTVTLHVRDASLREVVEAVLGDAPVVVRRTERLLVVRPAAEEQTPPPPGEVPEAEPPPAADAGAEAASGRDEAERDHGAQDRVTFGRDIHVRKGERIKDAVTMGGDVIVEGEVTGDVVTMGGDLVVKRGGIVRGEMVTMTGDLVVEEGAEGPKGSQVGFGGGEIRLQSGKGGDTAARDGGGGSFVRELLGSASKHALLFLLGLLLLGLVPARLERLQHAIIDAPLRSGATGVIGLVGSVVLCIVLVVTLIGIPGAVVVGLGAFVGFYVGLATTATVLGAALPLPVLRRRPVLQLLAGIAVLFALSLVPTLGWIATALAAALGFGALLLTRLGARSPAAP